MREMNGEKDGVELTLILNIARHANAEPVLFRHVEQWQRFANRGFAPGAKRSWTAPQRQEPVRPVASCAMV